MDNPLVQEDLSNLTATNTNRSPRDRIAGILGTTIFFALLTLIALVAIPYGTVEPWWQAAFECGAFGLGALWLIEGYLSGSYRFSVYRILVPLAALSVLGLLQTVQIGADSDASLTTGVKAWRTLSADPHETRQWVSRMLALVLVGAMLLRYTFSQRRLRVLIYLVIGIGVASALFGLMRKTTQHEAGFFLPYLMPGFGYGQFINNNHFAFLMEMAQGLALGLIVGGSVRRDRLPILLGVVLLLGMSLVLSNSRGGILSMLCQLIFVATLFPIVRPGPEPFMADSAPNKWVRYIRESLLVRALLIVCLIIIVSIGIVWVGGDPLLGRLEAIPGEVGTREEGARWGERRVEIWRATWQLIKAHPVAGVGMGGYWTAIPQYHDASGEFTPQRAHNDYLELVASGGLIGLALGAWFVYALIRDAHKRLRSPDRFRRAASFGALVGFSGVAVHSFVDFGLHIMINAVLFIALVVIATVEVRKDKQNHRAGR
jgi:putative inorganic carbon (HCO3(-)) transporter